MTQMDSIGDVQGKHIEPFYAVSHRENRH